MSRKRSKYKPGHIRVDTMAYVRAGLKKLDDNSAAITLRIRNHHALEELRLGRATESDIEILVQAFNMAEGFLRMNAALGKDWADAVQAAQDAIKAIVNRGRFICRAEEWTAMTLVMAVHDAQLDQATVKDLEMAMDVIKADIRNKKARAIT